MSAGRRCSCHYANHGAVSSFHRKAEVELFGARCEIEHVYTKNERIAIDAVAAELKAKAMLRRIETKSKCFD